MPRMKGDRPKAKMSITLDESLIDEIDSQAHEEWTNRSDMLNRILSAWAKRRRRRLEQQPIVESAVGGAKGKGK